MTQVPSRRHLHGGCLGLHTIAPSMPLSVLGAEGGGGGRFRVRVAGPGAESVKPPAVTRLTWSVRARLCA